MVRVLIASDDLSVIETLAARMLAMGYMAVTCRDGHECLAVAHALRPSVALIDASLPKLGGNSLCQEVKQLSSVPVVKFVTIGDKWHFDSIASECPGACSTVLFHIDALAATVSRILETTSPAAESLPPMIDCDDISIDALRHRLRVRGQPVHVARQQFRLLHLLMSQPGRVFSRQEIYHHLWNEGIHSDERHRGALNVHVLKLRQVIETCASDPKRLINVKHIGFKFETVAEEATP